MIKDRSVKSQKFGFLHFLV